MSLCPRRLAAVATERKVEHPGSAGRTMDTRVYGKDAVGAMAFPPEHACRMGPDSGFQERGWLCPGSVVGTVSGRSGKTVRPVFGKVAGNMAVARVDAPFPVCLVCCALRGSVR